MKLLPYLKTVCFSLLFVTFCFTGCNTGPVNAPLFSLLDSTTTGISFNNTVTYNESFNPYTFRNFFNGAGVAIGDFNNDGLPDIFFCSNQQASKLYLNKGDFRFEDITTSSGIDTRGAWVTGASVADVNGDGLPDIYVCKSGDSTSANRANSLYINKTKPGSSEIKFADESDQYGLAIKGLSTHAAFFDYDNDGDLDCYLLTNSFRSVSNYTLIKDQRQIADSLGGNKLFRNDHGKFVDVTAKAGIYSSMIGFGLGVTISDLNKDGWQDIYVSNDFFERDYLYLNKGDGTFIECAEELIREMSLNSMGADIADINNDGLPEIYVTDMLPWTEARVKTKTNFEDWDKYQSNLANGYYHQFARNTLQLNVPVGKSAGTSITSSLRFSEIGRMAGVYATDWSWGALVTDLDNDGLKDIFVANGIAKDITDQDYIQFTNGASADIRNQIVNQEKNIITRLIDQIPSEPIPNRVFRNKGQLQFEDLAKSWGLDQASFSNGAAYADFDNDGDLDLVVNNVNMPAFVHRNELITVEGQKKAADSSNYIKITLRGEGMNTTAIGAKVSVYANNQLFYQEQMPMRGFQSSVDNRLNFGLGSANSIDSIVVYWPLGKRSRITKQPVNQSLILDEKQGTDPAGWLTVHYETLLGTSENPGIDFRHTENPYNDFDRDRLLFQMISTQGPRMAVGDLNGDGLEDLFICGAHRQKSALYLQTSNGRFRISPQPEVAADSAAEDTDAIFFDADGDGDQDLFVCSGGNEFTASSPALANRLYLNDGKGNLLRSSDALPTMREHESSSCVRVADFDNDGDQDLFIGSRLHPYAYGNACRSLILRNDGKGRFTDVTADIAPALVRGGMVTDAGWVDLNKDGRTDLVICGEYSPIQVFINQNGRLEERTKEFGLGNSSGWWNRITIGDYNGDGYPDIAAANHGTNSRFKASPDQPVSVYVGDFDGNGNTEQVITCFNEGRSYPVLLRHDLVSVLPGLKKRFLKYHDFKEKTIDEIFSKEQLTSARKLDASCLESSVFINKEGKGFTRIALPAEAQISQMYAIVSQDLDNDGKEDLFIAGNFFQAKPETGIYGASYGTILKGNGDGNFESLSPAQSGLLINGAVRDGKLIHAGNRTFLLVSKNNDSVELRELHGKN